MKVPEDKVIVDSHAHFHRSNDVVAIVNSLFSKGVRVQAICDYALRTGDASHVHSYGTFVEELRRRRLKLESSDDTATVIKKDEEHLVLLKGREIETTWDEPSKGLFRDEHSIHVVVLGSLQDIPYGATKETLRRAFESIGYNTIAHPFTVPCRNIGFSPANKEEVKHLEEIADSFRSEEDRAGSSIKFEGLNSANALYMNYTNCLTRRFAKQHGKVLVYNTDMHARENMDLMIRQIGVAGTLFTRRDFNWILNYSFSRGRDLISYIDANLKNGEMFGSVQDPLLFGRIKILPYFSS